MSEASKIERKKRHYLILVNQSKKRHLGPNTGKVGRKIPPPLFIGGIYRYFPAWQIRLKWQIMANITFCHEILANMIFSCKMQQISSGSWLVLIERTFQREGSPYLACNDRNAFFTSEKPKKYHAWSCQHVCDALTFLLDNIFIRFDTKLYRQVVWIPMGTNCAPLVVDLFLFCYERDFMMSLSDDKQADVIDSFNTTSRYFDDILNINNVYFDNMVSQIYPSEL